MPCTHKDRTKVHQVCGMDWGGEEEKGGGLKQKKPQVNEDLELGCAEGRTRTDTGLRPLPPQDSVSTNFTTSAGGGYRSSRFRGCLLA